VFKHNVGLIRFAFSGFVLLSASLCSWAGQPWPAFDWPEQTQPFVVGKEHRVNGVRMKFHGFISTLPADQLVNEFKRKLGSEVVENRLGNKVILGKKKDDFHIAIQVENLSSHGLTEYGGATPKGSKGFYSISDFKGSVKDKDLYMQERRRWLDQLPAGTRLINSVESLDPQMVSEQWTFSNRHGIAMNKKAFIEILKSKGYSVDKDSLQQPSEKPVGRAQALSQMKPSGAVFFSGPNKEATVVFSQMPNQDNMIVVTTIEKTGEQQ
jgi:hypothetical protein